MHFGIHLPHAGERATPALISRFAIQAEALGFADVWVSEHIILPRTQFPRPLPFYEPVLTLTWVAAVTERVRLGTSVLVLPMRHPIPLAKELATLQNLSDGRLILGAGVGWLAPEFAALGAPFHQRGRRMDEGIALMRAVWTQDPVTFPTKYIPAEITDMTMTPLPIAPIPLWICVFRFRSNALPMSVNWCRVVTVQNTAGLQIGAFVVKFNLPSHPIEERGLIRGEPHAEDVIIKLDRAVIAKRMQQTEPGD